MIPGDAVETLAAELLVAERTATPVAPLTERLPQLDLADAYAIQRRGRDLRVPAGERLAGRKIGLTSAAMQQLLGVGEPDFGYLTGAMVHSDRAEVESAGLIEPRVEAEIALRLSSPLSGHDVDRAAALAAIGEIAPALEVVDSRIADWRIALADTVADNASSGLAVLGRFMPLGEIDLAAVEMTMTVRHAAGGTETATGPGSAVLGHPAEALAWLARTLASFGEGIAAGEIVIPGAMAAAISVHGAAGVSATFTGLGRVNMTFAGSGDER